VTSRIVVALRVKATPARAFEVFAQEIDHWWRPDPLFQFTPRRPGVPAFEPGPNGRFTEILPNGKVFEIGRIRAWEPPSRLVFGWRLRAGPGHRGGGQVRVARHSFPDQLFLRRHAEWWQALLGSMQAGLR